MNHDEETLEKRVTRIREMPPGEERDAEITRLRAEAEQ